MFAACVLYAEGGVSDPSSPGERPSAKNPSTHIVGETSTVSAPRSSSSARVTVKRRRRASR